MMDEEKTTELLGLLEDPPAPRTAQQLLARHRRENTLSWAAVAALVALAAGFTFLGGGAPQPDLTPRGFGQDHASLELRFAVEGEGLRRGGDVGIGADERLVFQARAGEPGYLCLRERAPGAGWVQLVPRAGERWAAIAGDNVVMEQGKPQSWRPDGTLGRHTYELLLDREDPACGAPSARHRVEVDWLP